MRINCTTMKESGSCDNRKVFYMDQIEKAVLSGLKQHLEAPGVLKAFVESYQQERERLASDRRRRRGELESKLEKTTRQLDRAWSDYETERLPTEITGARMRALLARQTETCGSIRACAAIISLQRGLVTRSVWVLEDVFICWDSAA